MGNPRTEHEQPPAIGLESDRKGRVIVEVIDDGFAYDAIDQLVEILRSDFSVVVLWKLNGPDARIWWSLIDWRPFEIAYDDMIGFEIKPLRRSGNAKSVEIRDFLLNSVDSVPTVAVDDTDYHD